MKLAIIFLLIFSVIQAQSFNLSGIITDIKTSKKIPYVNIGLLGTKYGTSSDEVGEFKIVLQKGIHVLQISCIGYNSKQIKVSIPYENSLNIELTPSVINLPEVLVNADENPAYSIIRKAIENKAKNKKGLKNYFYNFYSKNKLLSGNDIVFLEEDVGEGFNAIRSEIKEYKTKITSTENISKTTFKTFDLDFFENKIIDFSNDSLILGKFVFHLPISQFAFDYYDYELLGIKQNKSRTFYQIKVIPYSKIRPTFSGELLIDDSSYALAGLNLTLENRNFIPYTNVKLSVIQNIEKIDNYWLPIFYSSTMETNFNYNYLFILDSAITSFVKVMNNHKINLENSDPYLTNINRLDDTSFNKTPTVINFDIMDSIRLFPVSNIEKEAIKNIDSNKEIVSSLKLGGIGGEYFKNVDFKENNSQDNGFNFGKIFKYINFKNNRVDGIALGLKYSTKSSGTLISLSGNILYSFARKAVDTHISSYFPLKNNFLDGIELTGNYGSVPFSKFRFYSDLWNSIGVSIGFEDQFNYFHSISGKFGFDKKINKNINLQFGYTYENQKSLEYKKYYSLFNLRTINRINPEIKDGIDSRIFLNLQSKKSPFEISFIAEDGFISEFEFSNKYFGSSFNYLSLFTAYQFYFDTFFDELFFSPYLGVFIEGSAILGKYDIQHLYTPQTSIAFLSPFGTFKSLMPYQLTGDKSLAIHLEHNWRKTFFDMLGIYFPVAWNFEFVNGVSALNLWNKNTNKFYWEIYAGISGILGVLNFNIAYNKYNETVFRLGLSKFLNPKF
ncbi:MAG: carboxypeptidase-like regulatory domain-containing protein [Ignavibacteriae bacterium]|nr:carboxypeptidase-like regulatory domain-containing protein [Ignavibacteriota bacterium]